MENQDLKKIVAAMLLDTKFEECSIICKALTNILSDLDHDLDMINVAHDFDEIRDSLCSVLPILHDEYINR